MRSRVILGIILILTIIVGSSLFLLLTQGEDSKNWGKQAIVPVYGLSQFPPTTTITLETYILDSIVPSLFGAEENIVAVRLWGQNGEVEVLDWRVTLIISGKQVGNPVAYMRSLSLDIVVPNENLTVTDIEFSFANQSTKHFPFGELQLQPRQDSSIEEMIDRSGMFWDIYNTYYLTTGATSSKGLMLDLFANINVPQDYIITAIDLRSPFFKGIDSSACLVDSEAFIQSLNECGDIIEASKRWKQGLPLPIVFAPNEYYATLVISIEKSNRPIPSVIYFHPELKLSNETGEQFIVACNAPIILGGVDPYSEETADFFKEWGH